MKKILILGGGFAGVECCLDLESYFKNNNDVEISLVSEDNFLLFTPMLPQVASGTIETRHIVTAIRTLINKTRFFEGRIKNIDPYGKTVTLYGTAENRGIQLHYDFLVIALGSQTNFFGMKDVEDNAYTMKTLNDAVVLRNRIIDMMEQAENETDPILRKSLLRFIMVGGGFAGVETAGEINDFVADISKYYPNIQTEDIKITLVEAGSEILVGFPRKLANFAKTKLIERGVEVILNFGVSSFDGKQVYLKNTENPNEEQDNVILASTLVWTAGVTPIDLIKDSLFKTIKGRILVDEFLQVSGFPGVFAIGDCCKIDPELNKKRFPPTAQIAEAHARFAAKNLRCLLSNTNMEKFDYEWKGQSAIIGKRTGVASFFGMNIVGFWAFVAWRNLYLSKMRSWEKRFRVWLDWNIGLFFSRDISRLKVMKKESKIDYMELDEVDEVW
jgi:NADH dehydrogenase|tara:strand:- start:4926 stop:6257 length:1332 start_codon:yes stop_codon:yes gene_type:complete